MENRRFAGLPRPQSRPSCREDEGALRSYPVPGLGHPSEAARSSRGRFRVRMFLRRQGLTSSADRHRGGGPTGGDPLFFSSPDDPRPPTQALEIRQYRHRCGPVRRAMARCTTVMDPPPRAGNRQCLARPPFEILCAAKTSSKPPLLYGMLTAVAARTVDRLVGDDLETRYTVPLPIRPCAKQPRNAFIGRFAPARSMVPAGICCGEDGQQPRTQLTPDSRPWRPAPTTVSRCRSITLPPLPLRF